MEHGLFNCAQKYHKAGNLHHNKHIFLLFCLHFMQVSYLENVYDNEKGGRISTDVLLLFF